MTKNYHVDGKPAMTRREFWEYLVKKGQVKQRQALNEKQKKEFSGELCLYRTKAGYVYAVI